MYTTGDDMQQIFKRVEQILLREDRPTAIACYNDQLAIQLIALIKTLGLSVPTDVSVVGFDNYQLSEFTDPSLTTINHLKEQLGRAAGSMILDMINHKDVKSITYPPELIIRRSVLDLK